MNISRLIRDKYFSAVGSYPVSLAGERFTVNPEHRRFWRRAEKGEWEPATFQILDRFLSKESVYCDIGSWIGPTVLYAARKARQVYSFEPDGFAYRQLLFNLQRNQINNAMTLNVALSTDNGIAGMGSFNDELGASESSLLATDTSGQTISVYTLQWQAWLDTFKADPIDMIKMDVEGGEFDLLPTMTEYLNAHTPIVYLSLHAPHLEVSKRKSALESVVHTFSAYSTCLDESLNEVSKDEIASSANLDRFVSYVLLP